MQPDGGVKWKTLGLGEVVDANRMATTRYKLDFKKDKTNEVICESTLSSEPLDEFRKVGACTTSVDCHNCLILTAAGDCCPCTCM